MHVTTRCVCMYCGCSWLGHVETDNWQSFSGLQCRMEKLHLILQRSTITQLLWNSFQMLQRFVWMSYA